MTAAQPAMVQLIEYWTDRFAEVDALLDEWIASTQGERTAVRTRVGVDRHDPGHHVEIIEFQSAADADRNSALPGTDEIHQRFVPLCTRGPIFTDLLICRDNEL